MLRRAANASWGCRARYGVAAALFFVPVLCSGGSVGAEVLVRGSVEAVQVEASASSVTEVLAALAAAFDLRYEGSATTERSVTGVFRGSLAEVLSRLLEDFDFVARRSGSGPIELIYIHPRSQDSKDPSEAIPAPIAAVPETEAVTELRNAESGPPWARRIIARMPEQTETGFGPGGFRCHRRPSACAQTR